MFLAFYHYDGVEHAQNPGNQPVNHTNSGTASALRRGLRTILDEHRELFEDAVVLGGIDPEALEESRARVEDLGIDPIRLHDCYRRDAGRDSDTGMVCLNPQKEERMLVREAERAFLERWVQAGILAPDHDLLRHDAVVRRQDMGPHRNLLAATFAVGSVHYKTAPHNATRSILVPQQTITPPPPYKPTPDFTPQTTDRDSSRRWMAPMSPPGIPQDLQRWGARTSFKPRETMARRDSAFANGAHLSQDRIFLERQRHADQMQAILEFQQRHIPQRQEQALSSTSQHQPPNHHELSRRVFSEPQPVIPHSTTTFPNHSNLRGGGDTNSYGPSRPASVSPLLNWDQMGSDNTFSPSYSVRFGPAANAFRSSSAPSIPHGYRPQLALKWHDSSFPDQIFYGDIDSDDEGAVRVVQDRRYTW